MQKLNIIENGTAAERITALVAHFSKGNKAAFGRVVGIASGVLAGLLGERHSRPGFGLLQRILTGFPTVSPDWLLFGTGPMLRPDGQQLVVAVALPGTTLPVPFREAGQQGLVQFEWRFWFPAGLVGAWFKVSLEPDAPRLHGLYAGLVGSSEHDPLLQVQDFYQRAGQRSYVVEVAVPGTYSPDQLREQLTASGWSPLPKEARRLTPVELW